MYQTANYYSIESQMSPVRIQGTKNVFVKNCYFGNFTNADLCSLSMGNTATQVAAPNALFENVICDTNGSGTANNFNSFTGHYGANAIMLGCKSANAFGPLYAFVLGSLAIIYGCEGTTSLATFANAQKSIYQSGGVNDIDLVTMTEIWLQDSKSAGANYGVAVVGGAPIYNLGGNTDTSTLGLYNGIAMTTTLPVNTVSPAVTGSGVVGQVLTTDNGSYSNGVASYTYQWKRNGVNIGGATAKTYTLVGGDSGQSVLCQVTAINYYGQINTNSNAISVA
jgi:hypothetical protein